MIERFQSMTVVKIKKLYYAGILQKKISHNNIYKQLSGTENFRQKVYKINIKESQQMK